MFKVHSFKKVFKLSYLAVCINLLIAVLLVTNCTRLEHISFNVSTPAIKNGVFIIKNDTGAIAYSGNIKNYRLKLDSQIIQANGYCTLNITNSEKRERGTQFEVYLEPGHYDITMPDSNTVYPKIISPSAAQQELSDYYTSLGELTRKRNKIYSDQNKFMYAKKSLALSQDDFAGLVKSTAASQVKLSNAEQDALMEFINKHPQSVTAAHLMTNIDYDKDPAPFYAMFRSLSPETRNTDEGKALGKKLAALVKLLPGHLAPAISGTTPDGKAFNPADFKAKKIYLVELWRASNELSRTNHDDLSVNKQPGSIINDKGFGVISVSLDHNRDWWTTAIKEDKLSWPQFSDLKGNESVNTLNWGITRLPTYYLVDNTWHIVERDILWAEIPVTVSQYMKHH